MKWLHLSLTIIVCIVLKSPILQAAKKQLTQRMEKLNDKMDEQKEITGAIRFEVWFLTCFV